MPLSEGWRDQYNRMLRSRARLAEAAGPSSIGSDEARDRLYHFFQDAFHLRDWLRYSDDPTITAKAAALWGAGSHIKATPVLALCHDICIGVKHFRVDRPATGDAATTISSQSVTLNVAVLSAQAYIDSGKAERGAPAELTTAIHVWEISSDGQVYDAVQLADDVIAAWNGWLRANGML
ncbi:hypothetical protein [Nonomuraea salmonea]|uniref:Uncharacterized protein n=1 Tax=Nonomuraea salmonea TaxID=46181 RepID=A0ABV5NWT3_9ACTN